MLRRRDVLACALIAAVGHLTGADTLSPSLETSFAFSGEFTWLVRIATTKALNAVRRPDRTVPLETSPDPTVVGTDQEAERRERAAAVRRAVAALPERQREAVVLRDLEGLSYEQVAAALGCSVSSVKSALFRGRQSLAAALAPHRPGGDDDLPDRAVTGTGQAAAPGPAGAHP